MAILGFREWGCSKINARVSAREFFRPRPFPVTTPTIYGHAYGFLDGAIDYRGGRMDRKRPYILIVNLAYRARPGCIEIFNTWFRSFWEFPVACIGVSKAVTPSGTSG